MQEPRHLNKALVVPHECALRGAQRNESWQADTTPHRVEKRRIEVGDSQDSKTNIEILSRLPGKLLVSVRSGHEYAMSMP